MCGILGYHAPGTAPGTLLDAYGAMARGLAHRGRQATGVAFWGPTEAPRATTASRTSAPEVLPLRPAEIAGCNGFVGHHRLSIIDLSDGAHQPLVSADGQIALAYNGEVYNYLELRAELVRLGHTFRTTSDTEVVLQSYLQWGCDAFARLNGDFALLLLDHPRRRLVAARDRFGVKPLFLWRPAPDRIAFSSELKGFLGLPGFAPRMNHTVAYRYLAADFPTDETLEASFLQGVLSAPPASYGLYDLDRGHLAWHRYWALTETRACATTLDDAAARLRELLRDAVALRLRADVPVGLFLSGGLDSTALLRETLDLGVTLPTFSSSFPDDPTLDETPTIAEVARTFGVANRRTRVDPSAFLDALEPLVWTQDEPFSTLNVYALDQLTRDAAAHGAVVVLNGSGADEVLAGYADYLVPAMADGLLALDEAGERFSSLAPHALAAWHHDTQRAARTIPYITPGARARHARVPGLDRPLDPHYKRTWAGSYLKGALHRSVTAGWMNKSLAWDNRYLDRSGMREQVELRVPFLDHRLVELAFALPPELLLGGGLTKRLLRHAFKDRLPESVVGARRKIGYEFPFCAIVAAHPQIAAYFRELLRPSEDPVLGLVDAKAAERELDAVAAGRSRNYNLWRVFNLVLWARRFKAR